MIDWKLPPPTSGEGDRGRGQALLHPLHGLAMTVDERSFYFAASRARNDGERKIISLKVAEGSQCNYNLNNSVYILRFTKLFVYFHRR